MGSSFVNTEHRTARYGKSTTYPELSDQYRDRIGAIGSPYIFYLKPRFDQTRGFGGEIGVADTTVH